MVFCSLLLKQVSCLQMARTHFCGKDGKYKGSYKFSKAGAFSLYSEQTKRQMTQGSNPSWGKDFSLLQNVQTDCGVHQPLIPSVPGFYPGGKTAGLWSCPRSSSSVEVYNQCSYISTLWRQSSGITTGQGLDGPGFEIRSGAVYLYPSRLALRLTQCLVQ